MGSNKNTLFWLHTVYLQDGTSCMPGLWGSLGGTTWLGTAAKKNWKVMVKQNGTGMVVVSEGVSHIFFLQPIESEELVHSRHRSHLSSLEERRIERN